MTPIKWVQKYDLRDGPQPIETGPVTFIPVLTLTDLEAWLLESPGLVLAGSLRDHLLAQVQAWKNENK